MSSSSTPAAAQPTRPNTARLSRPAVAAPAPAESAPVAAVPAAPTAIVSSGQKSGGKSGGGAAPPVENPEGGQIFATEGGPVLIPDNKTLLYAAKIATEKDKPILLDYYADSMTGKAFLGVSKENPVENILIKNRQEFTSPIVKKQMVGNPQGRADIIVETENSIYIISGKIQRAAY